MGGLVADLPVTDSVHSAPVDAQVLESTVVDEAVLLKLLRRAGRTLARPALECLELLLDPHTPASAKLTVLAALTYLLVPLDLIPDFIPAAGFSDDLVAVTALLGLCTRHRTPAVRMRAQRRLDRWFPVDR
ncbi:DUF1232 domain-containing protein [Cyanobium sp. FACHB-13342]|uniref:YkvA family protein n=1 Tax=Cyanobium sp. FACHB-13342 TaxID=2692793 RepID=UPI0016807C9C|nr:DUF1232 domain-containing protein [Cyanobium sp. FACHB-13342]MBD2422076.1 DUF1232 domain-containing protein [Cyanobium sp. FACHB-13342]